MNPNRIDPLAPPPKPPPSALKRWGVRFGVTLAGLALGASCPLWPPAVQPLCRVLATAVQGASSAVPVPEAAPGED